MNYHFTTVEDTDWTRFSCVSLWLRRVKSGISIAERISELTGIPYRTVCENLSEEFLGPTRKGADTASLGIGEQVRVPEPLVVAYQKACQVVQGSDRPNWYVNSSGRLSSVYLLLFADSEPNARFHYEP